MLVVKLCGHLLYFMGRGGKNIHIYIFTYQYIKNVYSYPWLTLYSALQWV